jgi:predicted dehydrogenase/nucleoside-diphosphate-sugar epimerase
MVENISMTTTDLVQSTKQSEQDGPAMPPSTSSTRRVAFLGTGYIADWHGKALRFVNNVELSAVCDQSMQRAQAFAAKYRVPRAYESLRAMLREERLDAVHVLLPPDVHFEACKTILASGVNVLLEKPMCTSTEECAELVALAKARGLSLGVGHNFLFSPIYEQLRRDVSNGILGPIDHITITWHRELGQLTFGPFDIWMLRDPRNIMLEVGSHAVAQMLDLAGAPDDIQVRASNPVNLPTGQTFFRRWQVNAFHRQTAIELRFSFISGFGEYSIHVRGSLGSATVDFESDTYTLRRHGPRSGDFDRYAMVLNQAKGLRRQARRTLGTYVLSKLHPRVQGNPYGASIAGALNAFYAPARSPQDDRISPKTGAEVIRICSEIGGLAKLPNLSLAADKLPAVPRSLNQPRILVLGGTGFIGQELVRQLAQSGNRVRLLVRNRGKLAADLEVPQVDCQTGDVSSEADLRRAMEGVEVVYHLARANVKSWDEYQRDEIAATTRIAERAIAAGVKRFIYTGTIDSYYAGSKARTITETTPLDPRIGRRNLYARAKAVSEESLLALHRERGLPLVILRPGIVIGRGGSPFHWGVGMWWHGSVCQVWGAGTNKLPLVLVEDVAQALVAALDAPDIEGRSFNLVGHPLLSANEYLDELDRCGGFQMQRYCTAIRKFYVADMFKWLVKVLVRHPERRLPSYRDWESRTQRATFDCIQARIHLGWRPVENRSEIVRRGIQEPLLEILR